MDNLVEAPLHLSRHVHAGTEGRNGHDVNAKHTGMWDVRFSLDPHPHC